jgi:hypothetical protein
MSPDFTKVTGSGGVETNLNFLRGEVARLSRENQVLNQELITRAAPRVAELIDALSHVTNISKAGNPAAKAALKRFFEVLDVARDEASALTIVRNGS